jgi:outer membrane protein OmpU
MAKSSATTAHDLEADDLNFGVSYTMGNITLAGVTQRREFSLNGSEVDQIDSTGLSVAYAANGLGVSAYMMSTDGTVSADSDNYGVGASYDLGGGASVSGGVAGGDADTVYDIGLNFTF